MSLHGSNPGQPAPSEHVDGEPTDAGGSDRVAALLEMLDEWVLERVRTDPDVGALLGHRAQQARRQAWARQRAARDRADAVYEEQQMRSSDWGAVLSDALDDAQLTLAVERVTTPIVGIDRRSVPVVRAQLLAWAVAVHAQHPDQFVRLALGADLADGPRPPADLEEGLPEPPPAEDLDDDLNARIAVLLRRRPDLAFEAATPPQGDGPALERSLDRSLSP